MNKLILAGFKRMLRIKTLYVCMAVLFFLDGFDIVKEYLFREPGRGLPDAGGYLLSGLMTLIALAAVFITSYLGAEHQFGTIRNKVIAGNDKVAIYISSTVVCYVAVMIMYGFIWLQTTVLGNLMLGGYTYSSKEITNLFIVSFLGFTMLTMLYVMMGMCIQSKSLSSVTAVVVAFVIMMFGVATIQVLSEPQYIPVEEISEQMLPECEKVPDEPMLVYNPNYLGGTKRKVFEAIHVLCPASQILSFSDEKDAKDFVASVAEAVVLLGAGIIIFKKRDLK